MLYQDGDIFLIDEFFDDFDPVLRFSLFSDVILTELKKKTVIFLSQDNRIVRKADQIFVFDNNTITESGTYDELLQKEDSLFRQLLKIFKPNFDNNNTQIVKNNFRMLVDNFFNNMIEWKMTSSKNVNVDGNNPNDSAIVKPQRPQNQRSIIKENNEN